MASAKLFLKSGHPPTLLAAFLYFDFSFAVWVLNGAMWPFISDAFKLSAAKTGLMVSVPTLAGAFMRFPLGILSQYIGRKNAAIVEMTMILLAMAYGYFFVRSFNDVLAMGVLLGIAGASFGVALSLGSGWFPPQYKGLAMGIAGAGNSGTVLATLFAPMLATRYGWHQVYGFAGLMMLLPLLTMVFFAKEPPDREHQSFKEHVACLWGADGWVFNLVYIITFGGFIGLSTFLPSFFYAQFHVTKIQAGQLTTLAAIMGSALRIVGGYVADKIGGIVTLSIVLLFAIAALLASSTEPSLVLTTLLFMLCFSAFGAGNGALFQLVPLRWPLNTAVAGSMIGEIGALGGAILPNAMGLSKTYTGSFATGFVTYSIFAAIVLATLHFVQKRWVGTWIGRGGKPILALAKEAEVESHAGVAVAGVT